MQGRGKICSALLALSFLFIIVIPLSASEMKGVTEIRQTPSTTFPIRIDQPGNYVLLSNLIVSASDTPCIQINADDVILDLRGRSLIGPNQGKHPEDDQGKHPGSVGMRASGIGIQTSGNSNIAVRNGTVKGFFCGVNFVGANHEIEYINASSNYVGIKAESSTITNCTTNDNDSQGIEAKGCSIINCTANQNGSCGLQAESCTIINCKTGQNGSYGFYSLGKCRIEGCIMRKNGNYGLYLSQGYSYTKKNIVSDNTSGNVYMDGLPYLSISDDKTSMNSDLIRETIIAK